jgi:hypothetical protein
VTDVDYDLRHLTGSTVLDQGFRPTCVAFAISAAHESARTIVGADPAHLAPEAIWSDSVSKGTAGPGGMRMWDARSSIEQQGQPLMATWPYNAALGAASEPAPTGCGSPPWLRASFVELTAASDGVETEVEASLEAGRPVAITVAVTPEFYRTDADGNVDEPLGGFAGAPSHAVLCLGATTHPARGRLLLVKNSWGPAWGSGGFGYVPKSYLRPWLARVE